MDSSEDLVATLEGDVERLKVIFDETKAPLNDDVSELPHFCVTLEGVLRHQQKEKVSFWGERRDYWSYLSEGVGKIRTLGAIIKRVQVLPQLTTGQGRGRALIRQCLGEHLLADCVQNSISNTKRTKEWYHPSAILLSATLSQRVISALYDLSDVDFDLPVEGIDLDELWPSFVLKSFQSPESRKSLFGSTKEAEAVDKKKSYYQRSLERAVEEQPTEIFVKQEIPFDLELVGTLLEEIRGSLVGGSTRTQQRSLPDLRVTKMDDITSCLAVLRDYVASISHNFAGKNDAFQLELKHSREQITDLELQLQETIQESESSEGGLLTQLQDARGELKTCSAELQRLTDENASLVRQLIETRQQVSSLETLNFSLEEQLMEMSAASGEGVEGGGGDGGERRKRGYTRILLEGEIAEKDKEVATLTAQLQEKADKVTSLHAQLEEAESSLKEIAGHLKLLEEQVATECESKVQLAQNIQEMEQSHRELDTKHQQCLQDMEELNSQLKTSQENEAALTSQCEELESQTESLNSTLEEFKSEMESKLRDLSGQLESESTLRRTLEQERDTVREELQSMHGLVENETASYRFQLSSQSMELQQAREVIVEKEKMVSELSQKVATLESSLGEVRERCGAAEAQVEELRKELQDVEAVLHANDDEVTSLQEQLTENTLSRDQVRAQMLKLQNELDVVQMRHQKEKQELSRQVKTLSEENEDIRRAFKKLLEQKVTLWQHADELEQEQIAMGTWINDKAVTECMACGTTFTVFHRKHHCRSCGKVYCATCCDKKVQLPSSKGLVRVCSKCHEKITQMRTPFAYKLINTLDSDSIAVPPRPEGDDNRLVVEGPPLSRSSNSLNIERNIECSGNSLQAKLLIQNSDCLSLDGTASGSKLSAATSPGAATQFETAQTSVNPNPMEMLSFKSCNSTEYIVDPELKKMEAEKNNNFHIHSVDGETEDDSYYVVDATPGGSRFPVGLDSSSSSLQLDVNALTSKLASLEAGQLENAQHSISPHVTSPNMSGHTNTRYSEVVLEGGEAHKVNVHVGKLGTVIGWEFTTKPKGIAFGIFYKVDEEQTKEEVVLPLRRCVSHKTTLSSEYKAQRTGLYILRFDNCHSKYSDQTLLYKVWTAAPQ